MAKATKSKPEETEVSESTEVVEEITTEVPVIEEHADVPEDPVVAKLLELGVDPKHAETISKDLVDAVEDLGYLSVENLTNVGMKPGAAGRLLEALKSTSTSASAVAGTFSTVTFDGVLPAVMGDGPWLEALRSGGVLKIDRSTVEAAIRAALAERFGLFEIPKLLLGAMETYSDITEEQVGAEFFEMRKLLARRSYGDLFEALPGMDGSYVTEGRKRELFVRIKESLWPGLSSFNEQLRGWQEAWMSGAGAPMAMMASVLGGGAGNPMPPGLMEPPDTGVLRDAALTFNDYLNRIFRGTGKQITAALAYEAQQIMVTLTNPALPGLIGVGNRDLMLKQLGVSVPATYPRLEQNIIRYTLAILDLEKQTAGNEELRYLGALFMLGTQIPWSELGSATSGSDRAPTGIGAIRDGGRRAL